MGDEATDRWRIHASLLIRLRDPKDQAAWVEFDIRCCPIIRGWCRPWFPRETEDMVQEVYLLLFRSSTIFRSIGRRRGAICRRLAAQYDVELAAAKTLVMSLWKVPDEPTRELMEGSYRRILTGEGRADALRVAQMTMKAKYPDSYYWGAFICQGDPLPPGMGPADAAGASGFADRSLP
jgi:hypothetical protein